MKITYKSINQKLQKNLKKQQGFTLIEVMIALVIAVISIVALMKATSQTTTNIAYFQSKTLSAIVAENLAVEVRLNNRPGYGYVAKSYFMAGKNWPYRIHTIKTLNKKISKSEILVFRDKEDRDKKVHSAQLFVYLERE